MSWLTPPMDTPNCRCVLVTPGLRILFGNQWRGGLRRGCERHCTCYECEAIRGRIRTAHAKPP